MMHKCRDGRTKTAPKAFCDSLPLFMSFFFIVSVFFSKPPHDDFCNGGRGGLKDFAELFEYVKKERRKLPQTTSGSS